LLKRIDCTVDTTDMEEGFQLLQTVSSNVKIQMSKECQNPKTEILGIGIWDLIWYLKFAIWSLGFSPRSTNETFF
ncbi:MAG TPA: hypothetical protein VLK23_11120, partial [Thermodesulfobacteriota bacterium]|nr:hypothetical protein [Thermodesulfobacteriota bacterium]